MQKNKSFFRASSPKTILELIDNQRKMIAEEAIPRLLLLEKKDKARREVILYEGIKGLKSIYSLMLSTMKKGETIYAMGVPVKAFDIMGAHILDFNKKRIKQGISLKIIYHEQARKQGEKRKKMKHSFVRYLNPESTAPSWIDIFGDYVVIFDIDSLSAVLIKNANIARSFLNYFYFIWADARS